MMRDDDTRGIEREDGGEMGKRREPPTQHAEGQHGPRTHARFVEQLHETPQKEPLDDILEGERQKAADKGKRRLVEDREQHDESEKNSERTRLHRDEERRGTED
jgi:hypothetical protein